MDEYLSISNSCPLCRHNINVNSLLELPPDASEWVEPEEHAAPIQSAKIAELVKYLKVFDKNDKTLVFSQFTSFLDHVATSLKNEGIKFCRFDGSMSPKKVSFWFLRFSGDQLTLDRDRK
jgi:SWI/SNF-related matrix-associated actin-dependent regulator of chromatin subfamily A3